jgi:hypothetical protein
MTRLSTVAALTVLAAAVPVHAGDAQDITTAFNLFNTGRWLAARDASRDYLRVYGPRFSAAFIIAASECELHPHRTANRAAFVRLNVDYIMSDAKKTAVNTWISHCTSPPPPPPPPSHDGTGVSVAGLTVPPPRDPARPSGNEPAPRVRAATVLHVAPAQSVGTFTATLAPSDRCIEGYVWREAFAGDHVCVSPPVRAAAAADNALAADRIDPGGAYGPQTCVAGFVWREARPDDRVCVTPDRRSGAAADNAAAAARRVR